MLPNKVRVLGLDPGTKNFGWAVTEFNRKQNTFKPLAAGKIGNTVSQMDFVLEQTALFMEELTELIMRYAPDYIIVERFMNRGRFNGATGEYVSFMMGCLAWYALNSTKGIKGYFVVHSGTWKGAYNRFLPKSKGKLLDKVYGYCLSEPHEVDAFLLSHYGFGLATNQTAFGHLTKPLSKKQLQEFEAVSTGKKKKARK